MGRVELERIRDPIHGFIYLTPGEMAIVDSAPFQRLRRIHQDGLTHLVYPGAEHTRFQHSLGVMHLASTMFDALVRKSELEEQWGKEHVAWCRQLVRLYGLLHDIGHAPFSHSAERAGREEDVFPSGTSHEVYAIRIIKETEIAELILRVGEALASKLGPGWELAPSDLASFMDREATAPRFTLLRQLVSSELDVDKMDYLLRDSYYCGVTYGLFDMRRLEGTLTVDHPQTDVWRLAVERGGIHVVEAFVLARYYMFTQVYFHKVRRILDYSLRQFLREILPGRKLPEKVSDYLEWDDVAVERALRLNGVKAGSRWAAAITRRSLMRCVAESPTHVDPGRRAMYNLIEHVLRRDFGQEDVFVDKARKLVHRMPHEVRDDDHTAIVALDTDGRPVPMSSLSEIMKRLTEPINQVRVYASREREAQVKDAYLQLLREAEDQPAAMGVSG